MDASRQETAPDFQDTADERTRRRVIMVTKILEPILLLVMSIPVLALAIVFMYGYPIHAIIWYALTGWAYAAVRSIREAEADLVGIASAVVCVAAVVGLLHGFAGWLYREVRVKQERADWPAAWRWRWTLGLIGAVVLMFVAGLVGVGFFRTSSWLIETPQWFQRENSLSRR